MRIAICDDIKTYVLSIKAYAEEYFISKNIPYQIDEFTCGSDLLNSSEKYDVVFLDIELEDSNGIDIAKEIQSKNSNTVIIVVTSYRKYLDAAMDIKVTRYIDKPIVQERVFSALDRATEELSQKTVVFKTANRGVIRIKQSDIVYVEAIFKKVKLYTVSNIFELNDSLKSIREKLTSPKFSTPHNSYIVNLDYILDFHRDYIMLSEPYEKTRISIAPRKRTEFKRTFLEYVGGEFI